MAQWQQHHWGARLDAAVPRSGQRGGDYRSYVPDALTGVTLRTTRALDAKLASAERAVAALDRGPGSEDLAGIARFLLRSEAIASSRIEGIAPSARQIAFAELADHEDVRTFSAQARLVARNMTTVREAVTTLAEVEPVSSVEIVALHERLLADEPQHHGIRSVQNWIGGSDWHPLDAEFVPPDHERAEGLLDDLAEYLSGASHAPLVQAALVHAQFETIHPFTDGNGRVGRALIHTALSRRGLTRHAVLPISLVFATYREQYVDGLMAYRHDAPEDSAAAHAAREAWLDVFATAALRAAEQARLLRETIAELRDDWEARLAAHHASIGRRRQLRADSATHQILRELPAMPVMTSTTVSRVFGVTEAAGLRALAELESAGILVKRSSGARAKAYVAVDVLDVLTVAERALASTRFDTRASSPARAVPAAPRRT